MFTGVISDLPALEDFKGLILNIVSLDDDLVSQDVDCYTTAEANLPPPPPPVDLNMFFEEWNSK